MMDQKTSPKKFCFVLMPFKKDFKDIYELGIKQACDNAGAYCERVDEQHFEERILDRIYNQISKADIVIADMTGKNPNVFYEVGYAHALGKTTILLTQDVADIPFDFLHFPHIIYNKSIIELKEGLENRIKWALEKVNKNEGATTIDLELYYGSKNLSAENVIYKGEKHYSPQIKLTLSNKSFQTYLSQDFQIGIITDHNYPYIINRGSKVILLPDGKLLHILDDLGTVLFPNSFQTFTILFDRRIINREDPINPVYYTEEQNIIIRIFTSAGSRDYPLTVGYED